MKKTIKKATAWLMIVCITIGFGPAFGSAAAAEEKPAQSLVCAESKSDWFADAIDPDTQANDSAPAAVFAVQQPEEELEEMNTDSPFAFLLSFLKAIGDNLKSISVDEVLKLPANVMDDVVTYIFTILKFIVNIDSLYERITSLFLR